VAVEPLLQDTAGEKETPVEGIVESAAQGPGFVLANAPACLQDLPDHLEVGPIRD
jgi:hypothetical protein